MFSVKQQNSFPKPYRQTQLDDIPVATRSHSIGKPGRSRPRIRLLTILLIPSILFVVIGFIGIESFRNLLRSPMPGQRAGLSSDGRLLGHFPYPEADPKSMSAVAPGLYLKHDAARGFLEMQRAAAADGVELILLSAFRSISLQKELFFDIKADRNQSSIDRALVSAPPGFSEHSTGYAVDIGDLQQPQTNLSPAFVRTKAYQWLKNNAARHQFILSFPEKNPQGVNYEPWHWRYEGSTDSLRLFEPAHRLVRHSRRDSQQ